MSSHLTLDDDLAQSRTQSILRFKRTYEGIFTKYEREFSEIPDEIDFTDDGTEIEIDDGDVGTEDEEGGVKSASEMELKSISSLKRGFSAPSFTTSSNTTSAGSVLIAGQLRNNNSHSPNVARHDVLGLEEVETWKYPALPGDGDYVPEHHSTHKRRKRRRISEIPTDQDLEQSAASECTEDEDARSQKGQPLCISKLRVAKTNQSERSAGRARRRTITSEFSNQFTQSDCDLKDKLASCRDVKVPCPHPDCATHPTILYQSGRFSKKEESELIDHQRKVHDFSKFPCTFEGCPKRGRNGYYRHGNLVKHEEKEHGLYFPVKIRNDSEGKLESYYDVKAPCPHRDCTTSPTILYRVGRLPKEAESELIEHQRKIHDYSEFPCTVEGCPRQRGKGYFRHGNLLKHLEKDHPPDKKILPNKQASDSEDELA